jgi:membrane protease YdiL (CAAX protease family)
LLIFILSVPLWAIGGWSGIEFVPGLPLAAIGVVCPALAAVLLVSREGGSAGVWALLRQAIDYRRIPANWYVLISLLMPGSLLVSYGIKVAMGGTLPLPQVPIPAAFLLSAGFLLGGLCEELGWSGYATDPLQARWQALPAALFLGLVWAVWHYVPLLQVGRSPTWIAWWTLFTVALRVLLVWIYNNTAQSIFAAALFHAVSNVCTVLFPADFPILGPVVAVVAVIVTVIWGPRTLTRTRPERGGAAGNQAIS